MIYLLIIVYLLCLIYIFDYRKKSTNKTFWFYLTCVILILLSGLRYRIGGDTLGYMDLYDDYPTLFTVNRNTFRTRFQPLWDLFVLIHKTITPDCIYLHLGEGVSKCEEQVLSHELTLDKHIRFVGNQTEVRKYQIASDIYLMTSRFEGIPLTTIEAMACRIPAILYDVPGLRDFNKKDENSILIPEDYKVLADKLIFIKNNKWKSTEIAENAMKFVNTTFDMKTNVKKIIDLYNTQS